VGLGADHILDEEPAGIEGMESGAFTFLHVSSCFPRKAPDVLIEAFCREFTSRDDVRLVVKTFSNPHNEIEAIVQEACARHPGHAPIEIVWCALSVPQMRWLYERSHCLVSPSRGEGFGLPVAEAMLVGCPVVATMHGGQADICSESTCWPVDFRLAPATTHLTEGESYWAEPCLDSLRRQMRCIYGATGAERRAKTLAARDFVQQRFTWRQAAERHWRACEEALENKSKAAARIAAPPGGLRTVGFVTSWNTRCGIAEYSRYLVSHLPADCRPVIFANYAERARRDEDCVFRCWDTDNGVPGASAEPLIRAILESGAEAVSIQFNFGFFSPARLEQLVRGLQAKGVTTAVTMHATGHENLRKLKATLQQSDLCFCHRDQDIARLEQAGVASNVILLRHGIPTVSFQRDEVRRSKRLGTGVFVISSFGFLLPAKGLHHLLRAFALARSVEPLLRLNLLNALYPLPESEAYAAECLALIAQKGIANSVSLTTDFLEDEAILRELAASDLVVLPYEYSSESSSAAIRLPIASGTPVMCSDVGLFDEFGDCVHRFPSGDAVALANRILKLAASPEELHRFSARQARVAEELSWPAISREFSDLLLGRPGARSALPAAY
jgi:glycosyltransferase involved in cell wall biosynthesis